MFDDTMAKTKKIGNWFSAIVLGNTRELLARIDERITHILKDLDDIKPKVNDMSPKVDILWKDKLAPAHSPRQLNERGRSVLNYSGIKEIIDEKKEQLTALVKGKKPSSAYDAEQAVLLVVNEIQQYCPDVTDRLKDGAFKVGADIPTLLFVGSIYLRDQIFTDLGFSLIDLDKPKVLL